MTSQPTVSELLTLLDDSQQTLDDATLIEIDKRRPALSVELETALADCASAADKGYSTANRHLKGANEVILQAKAQADRLAETSSSVEADRSFLDSLHSVIEDLQTDCDCIAQEIEDRRQRQATFNITLYGRTMSGKSTLMEILTKGDGKSIGNGVQRATRDVRTYKWRGLAVTDVPGIAAFGGDEDEKTALEAARQSDLVLFLITDDAPQPAEAEHLARLRRMGLPLLGICNVKENLSNDLYVRRFIRDRHKHYNPLRLDDLSRQFDEMADRHTPGRELELVYSHLLAKFLADRPENKDKAWRDRLEMASQFWDVGKRILSEVAANGKFLRRRSFLNSAATANLDSVEKMLQWTHLIDLRQERLTNLVKELHSWRRGFSCSADRQIDLLIQGTVGSLRRQIPNFAELNCENENIEPAWSAKIKSASIERKVRETQQKLAEECQQYFKTMLKEMREEFRLLEINIGRVSIETGPIRDYRRWWDWGVAGVGALGTVAVFNFWNPVGWSAGAVVAAIGIGSFVASQLGKFFTSGDEKRREAVSRITSDLRNHLNDVEGQIRDDMRQWLDEFTRENVNKATEQINSMKQATAQSAALMRNTVRGQRNALLELNLEIIRLGLQHTGHADEILKITRGARIPGQAQALLTSAPLSSSVYAALDTLFNESIIHLPDSLNDRQIIESLTKGYRRNAPIAIDNTLRHVRLSFDADNAAAKARIRLASQLTGYHIANFNGA